MCGGGGEGWYRSIHRRFYLLPLSHFGVGLRRQPGNSKSASRVSAASVPCEFYGGTSTRAGSLLAAEFVICSLLYFNCALARLLSIECRYPWEDIF
jgi:hypothetical protein